jgi:hypothetical protein
LYIGAVAKGRWVARHQTNKSFLLLFFKKEESCFLCYSFNPRG